MLPYYDPEGDILILEALLNSERQFCPSNCERFKERKAGIFPDISSQVLKSHKRAIANWKLLRYQGVDPSFLYSTNLKGRGLTNITGQIQRRENPKIHDVIKKVVEKLLDAGLIYPISDSPWVSPVHCVPKKGGITVVKNDDNDLIPTRLVTGWRVCIDYRKLNEATRKDQFHYSSNGSISKISRETNTIVSSMASSSNLPYSYRAPKDQEKTTFTCPLTTSPPNRRMPLANAM
ncbi:hypothetical protein Tco_0575877 [Tanacetum coccineum]